MASENIKLLKSLKEDLLEDKERVSRLLDNYSDMAYGLNVDCNSEEVKDADVIHDALLSHIENLDEQINSIERTIACKEKQVESND